jgi:hypothetical protein
LCRISANSSVRPDNIISTGTQKLFSNDSKVISTDVFLVPSMLKIIENRHTHVEDRAEEENWWNSFLLRLPPRGACVQRTYVQKLLIKNLSTIELTPHASE